MGKRRRAREMAMQMLYQYELGGSPLALIFSTFEPRGYLEAADAASKVTGGSGAGSLERKSLAYARRLVEGTMENLTAIDALIRQHAENWRLERMPAIDRNILRLAIYEMLHEAKVPKVVIVDEAIELAKKFGAENSARFVNGLLDGVLQSQTSAAEAV